MTGISLGLLYIIRVKFAYHFRINYDQNLETAEFLEVGLCDFGETLFSARPRDFHEKMPATADNRLRRPQRGVAL